MIGDYVKDCCRGLKTSRYQIVPGSICCGLTIFEWLYLKAIELSNY